MYRAVTKQRQNLLNLDRESTRWVEVSNVIYFTPYV